VAAAVGLNLLSVIFRAVAWDTAIKQSIEEPHPRFPLVFSAFSVGLFANAVLPGRVGELARVAVLRRRMAGRKGATATLVGSVFAHRMFDVFPAGTLVIWVLLTARIPNWAFTSIIVALTVGIMLFLTGFILARGQRRELGELGRVRQLIVRAREGLAIMRSPAAAAAAAAFQFAGWVCQLFAVWAAMRAFHIHAPIPAAAVVLLLMNVATVFPLWPGNVGLVQVAIATPLAASYGVAYAHGVAYGFGLQAIEASVGIGVGLMFLAREGLSFAMLRVMPSAAQAEMSVENDEDAADARTERAGVPG
jgi:uncharacterized protein (TIRG00374 family)